MTLIGCTMMGEQAGPKQPVREVSALSPFSIFWEMEPVPGRSAG